jgi:MSHA biogenesis protein MshI
MFFKARRKPGWLAILPQGDTLTLAHVVRVAGSPPALRLLETFAVSSGVADALRRLRTARALKSYRCTTLLDDGEYTVTPLDALPVPREERREAVRWALKEMVAYPVDEACIDVLEQPADGLPLGRAAGLLAVSAPSGAVLARVAPFESARVRLATVDIPELAQRNVAELFEDANRGLVFLRLDERGMMLTLTFHGELQRSLDNFDRQYSHIPVSKVVLACSPPIDGLQAVLAESSYVPVHELDLSAVLDLSAQPGLRDAPMLAAHLLAIGAALRSDEAGA